MSLLLSLAWINVIMSMRDGQNCNHEGKGLKDKSQMAEQKDGNNLHLSIALFHPGAASSGHLII